jgi:hypothetical protein
MPSSQARVDRARELLRLALDARRNSLRHLIAAERAIWAPLIHRRCAELAAALEQCEGEKHDGISVDEGSPIADRCA